MILKETYPKLHKIGSFLWYKYHYAVWHIQKAAEEYHKPLIFVNEFGIIVLIMAQRGFELTWIQLGGLYLGLILISFVVGVAMIKFGALRIKTDLANQEDPMKKEILEKVNEILKRMNNERK